MRIIRAFLSILLIVVLSSNPVFSQTLDEAKRLNSQLLKLYQEGRYQEAIPLAKRALSIFEKSLPPNHPHIAISLNNLALLYESLGEYGKAEPLHKRALAIREKSLPPNHSDIALSLTNLAALYLSLGDYMKAEPLHKRALAIQEKSLSPDHPNIALSLNNLATIYWTLGDYVKAEPLYKRALAIREKSLPPHHPHIALSLSNLAEIYSSLGYYGKAEPLHKRSLAILEKSLPSSHPYIATSLNNLAGLYWTLGDYVKAEPLYKRALAIREKSLPPGHPDIAGSLNNLAELYDSLGDHVNAEPLHKRALAIREKSLPPDHPDIAISLRNLACLYLDTGRLEEALTIFKKTNTPGGLGKHHLLKKDYPNARNEFSRSLENTRKRGSMPHFLIADHIGLGLSFEGMKDWSAAKEHFRKAFEIIEKQWRTLAPQAKKDFLGGKVGAGFSRLDPYEGMVRVILREGGEGAGNDSFTVAESVKGRLFLEMLATREIKGQTPEDEALLRRDREHQQDLFLLRKQLEVLETQARGVSPETIPNLKTSITRKEKEYMTFIEEVKLKGGEVSSLIAADPLSPEKIQSLLDADTTLLEYFTTKESTYAWLMTKNDLKVYEIPLSEKRLKEQVDSILLPNISNKQRKLMLLTVSVSPESQKPASEQERENNRQQFHTSAKDLSALLLAPLQKDIHTKNLIIIPHGVLHKVPFAVLTNTAYSLSILPAASVMEFVVKKRKLSNESLFLIANPKTDYIPLDYAEKEGKVIESFFPRKEIYIREAATETITKKRAPFYQVIHFASHGEFNERQPLQSGLILAKDAENDGYLQVHEIFSLDLPQANLVTLSACETALAKIQGGDDLVGLSRGFLYAGSPSLLATLWQVDDESTSLLMEQFYTNWLKKGMTKPEALRQAQISIRQIPGYRHPYYWAPFVMIGDWK